jgi:hypothetical protein
MFDSNSGQVRIYQDDELIYDRKWEQDTGPILWGRYVSIGNRKHDSKMVDDEEFEGDMDSFDIYHTVLKYDAIARLANKCRFSVGGI